MGVCDFFDVVISELICFLVLFVDGIMLKVDVVIVFLFENGLKK